VYTILPAILDFTNMDTSKIIKTPSPLIPEHIAYELKTKTIGSKILHYEQTTSTMDSARELVRKKITNGTGIFADLQTQGRGRSNNLWYCPAYKGLLFTILLKHTMNPDNLCLLTGTMAVSITEMIREILQLRAEIKWPNDLYINGKKMGGILVTIEKGYNKQLIFLIGIGINVNITEDELPCNTHQPITSLAIEKGKCLNRISFAKSALQYIDKWYLILKDEHFNYITKKWKEYCMTIGTNLTVTDYGQEYTGKAVNISYNGGRILRLQDGRTKSFRGEHISIKKDPPYSLNYS